MRDSHAQGVRRATVSGCMSAQCVYKLIIMNLSMLNPTVPPRAPGAGRGPGFKGGFPKAGHACAKRTIR